jgi:hypothetical protein
MDDSNNFESYFHVVHYINGAKCWNLFVKTKKPNGLQKGCDSFRREVLYNILI